VRAMELTLASLLPVRALARILRVGDARRKGTPPICVLGQTPDRGMVVFGDRRYTTFGATGLPRKAVRG
jgi:hypothetical protein